MEPVELRWKMEPEMPNKGREDRWTLQYRVITYEGFGPIGRWSEWMDVPYYAGDNP